MAGGGTPEHRYTYSNVAAAARLYCARAWACACPAPEPAPARRKGAGNTVIGRARPITVTAQTAGTNGPRDKRAPGQRAHVYTKSAARRGGTLGAGRR